MAEINISNEKVLYEEHGILKLYRFGLKKQNGEWDQQKRVLFNHGNAVTVLLYNQHQKTVVLTRQFRLATYVSGNKSGELLEACAGLLEKDEKPEDAIIREVKEETGYEINEMQKIAEAYSSPGAYTELVHYYIAPYEKKQKRSAGGGLEEEGEDVKVVEMSFEEALRRAKSGEIKDAKTLLLLYYLKAELRVP